MKKGTRFIGLDVHAASIAVAVAEATGEVRSLGMIPNDPEAVVKLMRKVGPAPTLRVRYEAGPCGYALYWQLTRLGIDCFVVAPTLVPVKAGDRMTDRRDAEKLARSFRSGDLTPVWVPDAAHEALRDLVRAREAAKKDELRARHRLQKFLLRHGRRPPVGVKAWTGRHRAWLNSVRFEHAAQEATRLDYLAEVEHVRDRILRLERALDEAIAAAPAAMRVVIASSSRRPGPITTAPRSAQRCGADSTASAPRSARSLGRPSIVCTLATAGSSAAARSNSKSSPP